MIVSTKGRYALRVMIDLSQNQDRGFIPLREIAERQNISPKYLEAIVSMLQKSGMVVGLRGKGGGYKLTREPKDYTVQEILELTEGTLVPVACLESDENTCPRSEYCLTLPMWKKLDDIIEDYFGNITLEDLICGRV